MIEINKWEEKQLRKTIPNLCVARTGKSKKAKRGKIYVEPTRKVLSTLKRIREVDYIN